METIIWDNLNNRQKILEYKNTQKEVISMELAVKQKGLEKIKDIRYFVYGGCLQPLINSISVKKTALELSKLTIDSLLNFFQSSSRTDKSTIVASLNAIFATENNLEILKVLSDVVNYREEVKKKKPVKVKGKVVEVPEEPVIENPLVVELREKSLQCIYYIVCAFYSDFSVETSALLSAVANVTDITSQFGRLVCNLNTELGALSADGDVTQRVKVMQNLEFALFSLVFFLRYDKSSALSGLLATPLLPSIQALSKEAFFCHYAVQLLEIISRNVDSGVVALLDGNTLEFIVQLLPIVVKPLQEASAALAAAAVPGKKEVKKEAPPKKGAPVVAEVVDPYASVERIALEPKRQSAADTKLLCNVLIALAAHQSASIRDSACEAVSSLLAPSLLNSVLWEVTREPLSSPLDVPLHDTVDSICVLLGTLCEKAPALRNIVVQASGLSSVLSVLQHSKTIVNGTEPVAAEVTEKSRAFLQLRLNNLRRVAGKAALHLITPQCILPIEDEEQAAIAATASSRWQSCGGFSTDTATLIATPALFTQIIDLIAVADDVDLSNRGVRLLSAVLLCCGDSSSTADFIVKTGLDTLVAAKLSVVAQSRGQSIIDFFAEEAVRTATVAEKEAALAAVDENVGENGDVAEKVDSISAAVAEEKKVVVDLLVPSMFESFYLSLSTLEQFLSANNPATTPDVLKAFVTRERVKVLSQVLTVLGPLSSVQLAKEHTVVLRDPRVHNWYHTIDYHNTNAAAVPATATSSDVADSKSEFIRPLLMDVLALVASADAKYRAYEGEVPPPPASALPPSKSVVEEYSLAVCRLCADAVCSIVLLQGQFKFVNSSLTVAPAKDTKQKVLVLDAALRLLTAIASCGALGVTAAVEAIAENGFAVSGAPSGAMSSLLSFLRSDESFAIPERYEWKRPQFFSDVFPSDAVLTRQENISNRHILFPFIVLCGALHGVLADPTSTRHSAYLAMQAVVGITRVSCLEAHSQPVVTEVLSAAFVLLGGALTLTSLLGRFGNLDAADQQSLAVEEYMTYLLSRSASRETFWAKYADDNNVVKVIDPKTGKPVVMKEEKKMDPHNDKKVDPKAAVAISPIVAVSQLETSFGDLHISPGLAQSGSSVSMGSGWDVDIVFSDDDESNVVQDSSCFDHEMQANYSVPTAGIAPRTLWCSEAACCADHFAAGSAESALKLLNSQIAVVDVAPLKLAALSLFVGTNVFVPGFPLVPSNRHVLFRDTRKLLPALTLKVTALLDALKQAYRSFTNAQFGECKDFLDSIVHTIPLISVTTRSEVNDHKELLDVSREYITAIRVKAALSACGADVVRGLELVAYLTHCNLQPSHLLLALKTAMASAFKNKNFINAASFARRLLELPEINSEKHADSRTTAQKVLQKSEQQGRNEHVIDYDEKNPFNLDCSSFKPLYKGTPTVKCAYCSSHYAVSFKGNPCLTCGISIVVHERGRDEDEPPLKNGSFSLSSLAISAITGANAVTAVVKLVWGRMQIKKVNGIVSPDHKLENREDTFGEIRDCLISLETAMVAKSHSRDLFKIPMLAGPSGIGKTSVVQAIANHKATDAINIKCHIKYYNGYSLDANERKWFSAVSSVFLRMLYMIFLDGNSTSLSLSQFIHIVHSELMVFSLSASDAVEILYQLFIRIHTNNSIKRRTSTEECGQYLKVLLCVDECHEINTLRSGKDISDLLSPLDDVCQSFLDLMIAGDILLFPLLAGTDYEAAVNWSAQGAIQYIVMPPVDPLAILESVKSILDFPITETVAVRAYQLSLPRPVAEFARALAHTTSGESAIASVVANCYDKVVKDKRFVIQADLCVLLEIVARAITQLPVLETAECAVSYYRFAPAATPQIHSTINWAFVRRAGLCTLDPCFDDAHLTQRRKVVRISYPILEATALQLRSAIDEGAVIGPVMQMLMSSLNQLIMLTGHEIFALQHWQCWERFGAIFEALMINCHLYLGITELPLSELFKGCITKGCNFKVKLLPAQVIYTTQPVTSEAVRSEPPIANWCSDPHHTFIVVNNDSGAGVDYMYCLPHAVLLSPVSIKNQRKDDNKALGTKTIHKLFNLVVNGPPLKEHIPDCCAEIVGIFSLVVDSEPNSQILPDKTVYFGRPQADAYHGSLKYHPAANPFVSLNYANITSIANNLTGGNPKLRREAASCIVQFRNSSTKLYSLHQYEQHLIDSGYDTVKFGKWIK